MSKATAVISFSTVDDSSTVSFSLEQKDYPNKNPDNFATWLTTTGRNLSGADLFSAWYQYLSGCSEDGSLCVTLRVRLSDIDLEYNLRSSYGEFGEVFYKEETRTEYLKFELDSQQSIDFGEITSAEWNGNVYDEDSNIITVPAVTLSGNVAKVGQNVLGILECQVTEKLYEHELKINPRTPTEAQAESEESILDELYATTAWLFCNGGIDEHEIDMPDNFGTCSGGYGGGEVVVDDDDEGEEKKYNVRINDIFDYCTGNAVSNPSVFIDGVQVIGDTVELASGVHTIRVTAEGYTATDEDDLTENDTFTLP